MKKSIFAGLLSAGAISVMTVSVSGAAQEAPGSVASNKRPWMNARLTADKRVELLLGQMTLDEKIALLHGHSAFPIGPFKVPEGAVGSSGFVPGNARLGIPALQESDASLGVANTLLARGLSDMSTALPSGLALASTFDPAIAFAGGAMVGNEARAKTINVQLAGGVNLARDPRNGRNFEYVGEDPLLAGILAGEQVRGIQSQGIISTLKHFALNGQEHNRNTVDSIIDEGRARESDLLAFEIAIERGKPGSIMCAYNLVNGVYSCKNEWLLNSVLKRDWGYEGFVMSDWGATHGVDFLAAGLDQQSGQEFDGKAWFGEPLKEEIKAGKISSQRVDDAARRILRAMFVAGLFDRAPAKQEIDFTTHAQVARREAEEGIVLLENRASLLPLGASAKRVAVIGGYADAGVPSGMGSSQVTTPYRADPNSPPFKVALGGEGFMAAFGSVVYHPSPPLAALRARLKDAKVSFDSGFYPSSAAELARNSDVVILFVNQPSGEAEDVPDMGLPSGQDQLVEAVTAANPNTVVVIQSGNPVRMPWADKAGAIVEAWYSGSKGGEAIADVLTGKVNPSGRLPITWPVDESQLPRLTIPGWGAGPTDVVKVDYNREGADVGYRWYASRNGKPRYWFGHGLSYTHFAYDNLTLGAGKSGSAVTAQVTVRNTGDRAGKDVVQLYLTNRQGAPIRRLVAFVKVPLEPGESRRVSLPVDPRLLADFDPKRGGWTIPAGRFDFAIGTDAGTPVLAGNTHLAARSIKP